MNWLNQVAFEIVPVKEQAYIFTEQNIQITNGTMLAIALIVFLLLIYAIIGLIAAIKFILK